MFPKSYAKAMRETEFLDADTERALLRAYRLDGDMVARERIIKCFLKYIVKMAKNHQSHSSCTTPLSDLISEGLTGFIMSLDRFDLDAPGRLSTFSYFWVRAFVSGSKMNNNSIVNKLSGRRRRIYQSLNGAMRKRSFSHPMTAHEVDIIAQDMGVKPSDVIVVMTSSIGDDSIDEIGENVSSSSSWDENEDEIVSSIDSSRTVAIANEIIDALPDMDRDVIRNRTLAVEPLKVAYFTEKYGVSHKAVRDIEDRVIQKIRKKVVRPKN